MEEQPVVLSSEKSREYVAALRLVRSEFDLAAQDADRNTDNERFQAMRTLCNKAGKLVNELVVAGAIVLNGLPAKLQRVATAIGQFSDESGTETAEVHVYDLYWPAFVGWAGTSDLLVVTSESTSGYVLDYYQPGSDWHELCQLPDVAGANTWPRFCRASLQAIDYVLGLLEPHRGDARHSDDFRSVHWFGSDHQFTPTQASVVRILWQNWERGTPEIGDAFLLEAAGIAESSRLQDTFRNHVAWGTMIIEGKTKGSRRLAPSGN